MTSNSFNIRLIGMAVLIAALSAVGGVSFWNLTQARNQPPFSSLLVLPHARVIADFRLTDHHSQPFSLTGLRGKWSLIFFGFINCPDVCPGTLFELQKVKQTMEQDKQALEEKDQEIEALLKRLASSPVGVTTSGCRIGRAPGS
ncbi:MAG: SCO family protein [Lysobacterales bacterium]